MAMVRLKDLFRKDMNFYGLLNSALDMPIKVKITEFGKIVLPWEVKKEIRKLNNIKLKDFIGNKVDFPEWTLRTSGKLANWACFFINGEFKTVDLIEIDIMPWLISCDVRTLRKIADLEYWNWRHGERIPDYERIPNYGLEKNSSDYKRDMGKQAEFFKAVFKKKASKKVEEVNEVFKVV